MTEKRLSVVCRRMDGGRPYTSASHINVPPDAVGKNINGVINNALRVKKKKKSPFPLPVPQFAGPRGTIFFPGEWRREEEVEKKWKGKITARTTRQRRKIEKEEVEYYDDK